MKRLKPKTQVFRCKEGVVCADGSIIPNPQKKKPRYALFAFGHYYPGGGFNDFRGLFETLEQCQERYQRLHPVLNMEQGYTATCKERSSSGHVVDVETMSIVARFDCKEES